jgi:hypothetical protein
MGVVAAPRLDSPSTPTSMAAYYAAFLKALPKLLLSAADTVGNIIFLVVVIVASVLLFFLPWLSKDVFDAVVAVGGNPQPWALAPIMLLVAWQLLRANYHWARQAAEERDALRGRIDAAQVTRAHLDRLNDLRSQGVDLRDYGVRLGIQVHDTPDPINKWLVSKAQWENATLDCINAFAPVEGPLFLTPGTDIDLETYPNSFQVKSHEMQILTSQLRIVKEIITRFAPQARP